MKWIFCIGVDSLSASWTHLVSSQNHTTNTSSCQQAKSERRTHQNMNSARAKMSVHTGSRLFDNHRLLSSPRFSSQTQKSKLLSCRSTLNTWTLPLTVSNCKTYRRGWFSCFSTQSWLNHLLFWTPDIPAIAWSYLSIKHVASFQITLWKKRRSDTKYTTLNSIYQHLSYPPPTVRLMVFYCGLTGG